jgi:predicted enzyme related to lactoylglutathione lyase
MANIDKHAPGSFCWIELATSDQNAAKSFYGQLFGWSVNDFPMGPDEFYSMFEFDGRPTAAAYTLKPEDKQQGVPPHWMLYVAVDSADAAAARAAELGGKVVAPAFDVYDAGRMAVIQDPTGAFLCVWQPMNHAGTGISGVPGTLCWADLSTPEVDKAVAFYSGLFGWKVEAGENDPSGYLHIKNGEEFIGGIPPAAHRAPNAPPHWLAYFQVADCDATANKAKELGATFHLAPMTMEHVGRFAVLADPQGAVFSIFQSLPRE